MILSLCMVQYVMDGATKERILTIVLHAPLALLSYIYDTDGIAIAAWGIDGSANIGTGLCYGTQLYFWNMHRGIAFLPWLAAMQCELLMSFQSAWFASPLPCL
jgi:hypothetical protein